MRRHEIAFDDPVWKHIEHCSPCYCQFAEIREGLFKEERKRNVGRATRPVLVIIVLFALAASFYAWRRSRTGEQSTVASNRSEAAVLNFEDGSELRGAPDEKQSRPTSGVQHLPRNQLNLTVYLPLGSQEGIYELEMVSPGGQTVWRVEGRALIKDGLTSVPVSGDLRRVPIGQYKFRFRRPGETWHEKDVIVR